MGLRHRNKPVEAFSTYGADHSFAYRVRLRCPRRRFQHAQAQRLDRFVQAFREDTVPVVNQIAVAVLVPDYLPQLLQSPVCARVRSHTNAHQPAATVFDDNENVEHSEARGDRNEKVACHNRSCMVLQECRPTRVASWLTLRPLRHVLPYGPRRNLNAQFHQQLTGDSLLAPQWILLSHHADQYA